MIHWNIEESLNLICMQVHCDHTVNPGYHQHISNKFCSYRDTSLVLAILAREAKIGDNCNNLACECALGCINLHQQLKEVLSRRHGCLNEEHIVTPNGFFIDGSKLAVTESYYIDVAQFNTGTTADLFSQITCLSSGKNLNIGLRCHH